MENLSGARKTEGKVVWGKENSWKRFTMQGKLREKFSEARKTNEKVFCGKENCCLGQGKVVLETFQQGKVVGKTFPARKLRENFSRARKTQGKVFVWGKES
jgi:hypothetical protein